MKPIIKHHGYTDAKTAPHTFFYDSQPEHHNNEFEVVVTRLTELSKEFAKHIFISEPEECASYLRHPVQLIIEIARDIHGEQARLVAFRFTSDAAYDKYRDELVALGGGLGRGGWDPWKKGSYDYSRWMAEESTWDAN